MCFKISFQAKIFLICHKIIKKMKITWSLRWTGMDCHYILPSLNKISPLKVIKDKENRNGYYTCCHTNGILDLFWTKVACLITSMIISLILLSLLKYLVCESKWRYILITVFILIWLLLLLLPWNNGARCCSNQLPLQAISYHLHSWSIS